MSWITLDDHVGAVAPPPRPPRLVSGPVNLTAPEPGDERRVPVPLGAAVHRPTVLPTPLLPLKGVYGSELVQHLLVDGQRVRPACARSERIRSSSTPTSTARCARWWQLRLRRDVTPQPEPRVG